MFDSSPTSAPPTAAFKEVADVPVYTGHDVAEMLATLETRVRDEMQAQVRLRRVLLLLLLLLSAVVVDTHDCVVACDFRALERLPSP